MLLSSLVARPGAGQSERTIRRHGMVFSVPPGAEVLDRADGGGRQTYVRIAGSDAFARVMRGGEPARAPSGEPSATTLCGRPAQRYEIHTPETEAIGSYLDDDGDVVHMPPQITPARVEVIVALVLRDGTSVRVDWSVRADLRARHRAQEEAFFRSIRCE